MGIKFDKDSLALEQNNYATKIVNAYIIYRLNAWLIDPTNNFKLRNCLFCVTSIIKNSDKEKWTCSGYRIAFYGPDS